MSQVKLTLRPPPNVDFVHGYPGIPPGTDRPQASVKGAIEVRAGPQGVKAKWVRVELRKVETLPGGGLSNTFYDFVGPSPVTLWTASDEYGLLRSQDFPFQIRVPESVPPSLALESGAGIKYELLASVCTKGKRGFLRRRKSSVISTQASIVIDKHELHSTWPVYCQTESRQVTHEGVTLIVERNHTCFGPGDRISVMATLRSDSTNTVLLRGFELTLKESTIFRAGPYTSGKKSVPQVRVVTIDENKVPVNFNLYGGMVQKAELTCGVSPNHTSTSLNTARHIDITYVLSVKALLGSGPLVMDLPIVLSNWQRVVSHEAVRRIGPVPSLSLTPPGALPPQQQAISSRIEPAPPTQSRPNTANAGRADEPGFSSPGRVPSARAEEPRNTTLTGRTPSATASNRFTVTNAPELNTSSNRETQTRRPSASGSGNRVWPSAEEEKTKLWDRATANVAIKQGQVLGSSAPQEVSPTATSPSSNTGRSRNGPWPTAEEEKLKLWNRAQDAVNRTQAEAFSATERRTSPPPSSKPSDSGSGSKYVSAEQEKEALRRYHDAKQAVERTQNAASDMGGSSSAPSSQFMTAEQEKDALRRYNEAKQAVDRTQNAPAGAGASSSPPPSRFLSAEQEKEALRRYNEAKEAVDRTQNGPADDVGSSSAPVAHSPPPAHDMPPPFEASGPPVDARQQLAEKERMRRAYEAQDAAVQQATYNDAPPPPFPEGNASIQTAIQEKEMLRRKFAAQDAQTTAGNTRPTTKTPPPRAASPPNPYSSYRAAPSPPAAGGSSTRILTAAEEKAMLRARYEAENSGSSAQPPRTNGHTNGVNGSLSPSPSFRASPPTSPPATSSLATPPPLMPKPPSHYIQETQEEDARVSKYAMNGNLPTFDDYPPLKPTSPNRP